MCRAISKPKLLIEKWTLSKLPKDCSIAPAPVVQTCCLKSHFHCHFTPAHCTTVPLSSLRKLKYNLAPMLPSQPQTQQSSSNKAAEQQVGKGLIRSSPLCVKTQETFHVQLYVKSIRHTAHRSTWAWARRSEKTWHWRVPRGPDLLVSSY